jgi:integrase
MIDDAGLSARIGADQLGHAKVSMTQDRYMRRGRVHAEVAALLDRNIDDGHTAISVPPLGLEPRTCGLKERPSWRLLL